MRSFISFLSLVMALPLLADQAASSATGPALGVARVAYVRGDVVMNRGDSGDWVVATTNMPVVEGDAVRTVGKARAELELDHGNFVRLWNDAEIELVELSERKFRLRVLQGTVVYSELALSEADIDLETPLAAIRPMEAGRYRVSVTPQETIVSVRRGRTELAFQSVSRELAAGRAMSVTPGTGTVNIAFVDPPSADGLDQWVARRDRRAESALAYKYVSRDISGAADLDGHGKWRQVSGRGPTWFPRVQSSWVPYRDGRWVWLDYYGWSWVGNEVWGWAPYHWGRWYRDATYGWGWVPGGRTLRHVWRPALVTFIGYDPIRSVGAWRRYASIGWCPLGPGELYRPWYGSCCYSRAGRGLTINIVHNTNLVNDFQNARGYRGVSIIDSRDFGRGSISTPRAVRVSDARASVVIGGPLPVVPSRSSQGRVVRHVDTTGVASLRTRSVVARTLRDGTARRSFGDQQRALQTSVDAFRRTTGVPDVRLASGSASRTYSRRSITGAPSSTTVSGRSTSSASASRARVGIDAIAAVGVSNTRPGGTGLAHTGTQRPTVTAGTTRTPTTSVAARSTVRTSGTAVAGSRSRTGLATGTRSTSTIRRSTASAPLKVQVPYTVSGTSSGATRSAQPTYKPRSRSRITTYGGPSAQAAGTGSNRRTSRASVAGQSRSGSTAASPFPSYSSRSRVGATSSRSNVYVPRSRPTASSTVRPSSLPGRGSSMGVSSRSSRSSVYSSPTYSRSSSTGTARSSGASTASRPSSTSSARSSTSYSRGSSSASTSSTRSSSASGRGR